MIAIFINTSYKFLGYRKNENAFGKGHTFKLDVVKENGIVDGFAFHQLGHSWIIEQLAFAHGRKQLLFIGRVETGFFQIQLDRHKLETVRMRVVCCGPLSPDNV